jgi:hypothetical protein
LSVYPTLQGDLKKQQQQSSRQQQQPQSQQQQQQQRGGAGGGLSGDSEGDEMSHFLCKNAAKSKIFHAAYFFVKNQSSLKRVS